MAPTRTICTIAIAVIACSGIYAETPPDHDQSLHILLKNWREPKSANITKILDQAKKDPPFRQSLVNSLIGRLNAIALNSRAAKEYTTLRLLNATEAIPQLRQRWNEMEKKTFGLEFADSRSQLLKTIAQLLPIDQRVDFLIQTEQDKSEPSTISVRALVLLCATGNDKAVKHVISVYEKAEQKYPITTRVPIEDQPKPEPRKAIAGFARGILPKEPKWDRDKDMMPDYIEKGLLLDTSNPDTDGDGLLDGNDRNPLCKTNNKKLDPNTVLTQQIANFIFYVYARRDGSQSPFAFNLWIVRKTDTFDDKGSPSILRYRELTAVNGIVLHLDEKQIKKYRDIHGYGTRVINLHELQSQAQDQRLFYLSISQGFGDWRSYRIKLKRFNKTWLPVQFELAGIT